YELCQRLLRGLNQGQPVRAQALSSEEQALIRDLSLLTAKKVFFVANVAERQLAAATPGTDSPGEAPRAAAGREQAPGVGVSAAAEAEIATLDRAEQPDFLAHLGVDERGLNKVVRTGYDLLGLITFFTTGPEEVRAWTIVRGTKAPQAGAIHTDFERGFI